MDETVKNSAGAETPAVQNEYVLEHPFDYCGQMVERLPMRRIKAKDYITIEREMRAAGIDPEISGNRERTAYVLARASGQPVEVILEMDAVDFIGLEQAWGASFF